MLGPHSQLPIRAAALRLFAAMAIVVVVFAGCAATAPRQAVVGEEAQDESDADASAGEAQALAPEPADRTALPNQELTENLLYEFLLAEIAGQRGNAALSAQAYVDLAKRTRDPRIARRATEVALYARMNNAAIESATIWHETEPGSRPLQALAGLLVAAGRYDEALPNLRKLLAGSANEPANGFTHLTRTLANAQDKQAALKLVHSLAADYPKLAESHLAVARAAVNAGDERLALEEARKAGQLRPDWEAPALLEAQLRRPPLDDIRLDQCTTDLPKCQCDDRSAFQQHVLITNLCHRRDTIHFVHTEVVTVQNQDPRIGCRSEQLTRETVHANIVPEPSAQVRAFWSQRSGVRLNRRPCRT